MSSLLFSMKSIPMLSPDFGLTGTPPDLQDVYNFDKAKQINHRQEDRNHITKEEQSVYKVIDERT